MQIDTNTLANKLMKQRDQKIAGRSAGLGDSIAKITKATGLDKLAKKWQTQQVKLIADVMTGEIL